MYEYLLSNIAAGGFRRTNSLLTMLKIFEILLNFIIYFLLKPIKI